jgi:hypothetical protein
MRARAIAVVAVCSAMFDVRPGQIWKIRSDRGGVWRRVRVVEVIDDVVELEYIDVFDTNRKLTASRDQMLLAAATYQFVSKDSDASGSPRPLRETSRPARENSDFENNRDGAATPRSDAPASSDAGSPIDDLKAFALAPGAPDTSPDPSPAKAAGIKLKFVPKSLATKCALVIRTYHDVHGYGSLADILWQPGPRDLIEKHKLFAKGFKRACTERSSRRANDGFVMIAAAILSLEVLASDFANWGARHPDAKQEAKSILRDYALGSRTLLMNRYVFPRSMANPAFVNAFALQSDGPETDVIYRCVPI